MWGCRRGPAGSKPWADVLIVDTVAAVVSISPAGSDPLQGGYRSARGAGQRRCDPHHLRQHQCRSADIQRSSFVPHRPHPCAAGHGRGRGRPQHSVNGRRRPPSQPCLFATQCAPLCAPARLAFRPVADAGNADATLALAMTGATLLATVSSASPATRRLRAYGTNEQRSWDRSRPSASWHRRSASNHLRSCGTSDPVEPSCHSPKI